MTRKFEPLNLASVLVEALDPCGNRVEIRCGSCVARLRTEVGEKLARLSPWGRPACQGCGAPIAAVSDVIRGVAQL